MSDETTFPVESFKDAAPHLRRPFAPGAVKFKIQQQIGNPPTAGLIVGYIDARLVVERLNLVLPHLWADDYERLDGKTLLCRLSVDGITRQDVGESKAIDKGAFSDALKRAAVKFGIGVSLYALPAFVLNAGDGNDKLTLKTRGSKKFLSVSPSTDTHLRGLYADWLETDRGKHFGAFLDHGDPEEGSVGEPEPEQLAPDEGETFDAPKAAKQEDEIRDLYDKWKDSGNGNGKEVWKPAQFKAMLDGAKDSNTELDKLATDLREKAGLPK